MTREPRGRRAREDVAEWLGSLRFSGFTLMLVGLTIAGAVIVSPSVSTFVQQRREISELRESVRLHRESVETIDQERVKWKDPAYIRAQARDRLFYVLPGETQLSVIDDVVIPDVSDDVPSAELTAVERNWAKTLASSVLIAGTTAHTPDELSGETPPAAAGTKETSK